MSIRKMIALIPVCALAMACGGEQTPEAQSPEGAAAAEETKPAETGPEAAPTEGTSTPTEGTSAPAEGTAPADGAAPAAP